MNCNLLGMSLINCHVVLTAKFFERMPNLINFPTGTGLLKIFEDDILTKIWKSQISSGKSGSSYSFQGAQAGGGGGGDSGHGLYEGGPHLLCDC